MLFRESAEAVSVDQVWSDLRHHLYWTKGEPTIVFLAAQSHDQVDDLRERTVLWCRRNRERWTLCEPDAGFVDWLRRELPRSGVIWLDLWEEGRRTEVLHALNELRIRLSCLGGGCLVLCGPVPLLSESACEAADLWSVRSFAHVVRAVLTPPGAPHPATENVEWKPEILGGEGYRFTWRLTVPDQLRTPEAGVALQEVGRARSLLPADPVGARRVLDDSRISDSPIRRIVFGLTRAEIAGLLGDGIGAEANLASVMVGLRGLPRSFRADAADAVMRVGGLFGAYDAAAEAAEESLGIAREVSEELGTPQSSCDVSVLLACMGGFAWERGDLEAAGRYFQESLAIAREVSQELATPESRRDLALSLENVGRVAQGRGDLQEAAEAAEESLGIQRESVDSLDTLKSRRDLALSLVAVGRMAERRGDLEAADRYFQESLTIDRELADSLGTPESRRDLAISLDNVGRVAVQIGDLVIAGRCFEEALGIQCELVALLGTPESRRDLALSLNSVGRVAEQSGDLEAADRYYKESMTILREIAELVGTPQAIEDLALALGSRVHIAAELGDSALVEQLEAELSNLEEIVVENRS